MNNEMLFDALSEVGDDLIVMAEQKRFVSPWRKWGQTAAVLAVVVCLAVLALPYFPMGCGSSGERAESTAMTSPTLTTEAQTEECAAEETVEECVEVCEEEVVTDESTLHDSITDAEQDAGAEEPGEGAQGLRAEPLTKIICRGTYYYLMPEDFVTGVPPLGEELGTVTSYEDLSLAGCTVYTMPYSTWFGNYAVNGEPVTQQIYVRTLSGYRYGFTYNEKVVSRYTMDDVRQAVNKGNFDWLAETFAQPIETAGGVDFMDSSELSSEELNTMFFAGTVMNTGVVVANMWIDDTAGEYVVPISDVRWRLDRFLDEGYVYEPEKTELYDEDRHALVCPEAKVKYDRVDMIVHAAEILDENKLFLLISLPDQKGVTKEYVIRFDDDSWRYETIHESAPDGIAEMPLP